MGIQRTFLLVKPEAVERGFNCEIAARFEARGFTLVNCLMLDAPAQTAKQHCQLHGLSGSALEGAVERLGDGPCVAYAWEADNAVALALQMCGDEDPMRAAVGTIRGDLALTATRNLVDVARSADVAAREIELWFGNEK